MNLSIYRWLGAHHYLINVILIFVLVLIVVNLLWEAIISSVVSEWSIFSVFDKNSEDVLIPLFQQIAFLGIAILINFISASVYGDYWTSSQNLLQVVTIAQVISLLHFFITSNPKSDNTYLKPSLILGILNIILTFTHLYCFLFLKSGKGFANFERSGLSEIEVWLNFLFYSISLVIPYSLTELIPNTFLFKFISLFQIGLFYIFVFDKLSEILHNRNK